MRLQVMRVGAWSTQGRGDHPAAAVLQCVQADPGRDPVEPRLDRRPLLEVREASPRPQVRLLDGVLRVMQRAEHPVAVCDQLTPVLRELVLQVHPNSSTGSNCTATPVLRRTAIPRPARAPSNDSTPQTANARLNPVANDSYPPALANTAASTATPATPPSRRIMP